MGVDSGCFYLTDKGRSLKWSALYLRRDRVLYEYAAWPEIADLLPFNPLHRRGWLVSVPFWTGVPVAVVLGWLGRPRRRAAHECQQCGYDLRGAEGHGCPECGHGHAGAESAPEGQGSLS